MFDTSERRLRVALASGHEELDLFGAEMAISADRLVVAARQSGGSHSMEGAAYLFEVPSGRLLRALRPPEPKPRTYFGHSVAIDEGLVAVGSLDRVFLFEATSGTLRGQARNPCAGAGLAGDFIGFAEGLALAGDRLVVGAPRAAGDCFVELARRWGTTTSAQANDSLTGGAVFVYTLDDVAPKPARPRPAVGE